MYLLALVSIGFVDTDYLIDYAKVVEAYKKSECISYQIQYKSYDSSPAKPDTTLLGYFEFKANSFRSRLAGTESIRNEKYYLSVDHNNKVIFLTKSESVRANFLPTSAIDTIISKSRLIAKKEEEKDDNIRRYNISYPKENSSVTRIAIDIDLASYYLKKVTFYLPPRENIYDEKDWKYLNEPFIEMIYSKYSTTTISSERFALSEFINIKNGTDATLTDRYKNYTFINSISISKQMR